MTPAPFAPLGKQLLMPHCFSLSYVCDRYMLRYLRAVQMMKQIIEENNLIVMSTIARYACAYEAIAKEDWWDKARRCAPSYHLLFLMLKPKQLRAYH